MADHSKLRILFVVSEYAPWAKVGGLADAVAGLAAELRRCGHDPRIVLPYYGFLSGEEVRTRPVLESMCVRMGVGEEWCAVDSARGRGNVPVYLIRHEHFFAREGIYHDRVMHDYDDNPERFGFFCRAALQVCMDTGFSPDIVHAHDWPAAPTAAYLKTWFWNNTDLGRAASVLTIHNIAHQGVYNAAHYPYLGLGEAQYTPDSFEAWEQINFLKGGIKNADLVTTVSPTHAREITRPYGGFGLAPYLSDKGDRFIGLLNGVDYNSWSPQRDPNIPARFTMRDFSGKATCKRALQEVFGLEQQEDVCILGFVGRFVEQKGLNLIREAIEKVLDHMKVQFVILGSGEHRSQEYFGALPFRRPGRVGSYIGFSNERAHLITAGADFLLMPSLFEPCGLNQLYALRYGTPPIVRATGGLEDTVEQYDESTGDGTGFKFYDATPQALHDTIGWAVSTYYDRPKHMVKMMKAAMRRDFSWKNMGGEYERLYARAARVKRDYDAAHA
ncbi:MAG: glycosyltransferase [Chitinivibrionales bacterium]|nr:glycosyltransferase [Chitinivibrionales bacterium]MBD3357818.1 glycosyltransferase [Chitinivibrionales bacterium]